MEISAPRTTLVFPGVPEQIDRGLVSFSSSLEEKTSLRRGVRLRKRERETVDHLHRPGFVQSVPQHESGRDGRTESIHLSFTVQRTNSSYATYISSQRNWTECFLLFSVGRSLVFSFFFSLVRIFWTRPIERTHTHILPGKASSLEKEKQTHFNTLFALRDLITSNALSKNDGSYLWLNVFLVASIQWRESDMLSIEDEGTIYSVERERGENCLRTNRRSSSMQLLKMICRAERRKTKHVSSIRSHMSDQLFRSQFSLSLWSSDEHLALDVRHPPRFSADPQMNTIH